MKIYLLMFEIVMLLVCPQYTMAGQHGTTPPECKKWFAKVEPIPGTSEEVWLTDRPTDQDVLQAIGCLLQLHGNKHPARFTGVTHLDVSQILPQASVELAALYYISYLFTGNFKHADGIALVNRSRVINPDGAIDIAYHAYTVWFERVKSMGLLTARTLVLNPLQGTGLSWYGN